MITFKEAGLKQQEMKPMFKNFEGKHTQHIVIQMAWDADFNGVWMRFLCLIIEMKQSIKLGRYASKDSDAQLIGSPDQNINLTFKWCSLFALKRVWWPRSQQCNCSTSSEGNLSCIRPDQSLQLANLPPALATDGPVRHSWMNKYQNQLQQIKV